MVSNLKQQARDKKSITIYYKKTDVTLIANNSEEVKLKVAILFKFFKRFIRES